jgi:glycosyltransferase involved in cell wall biosynthesis
LNKISVIVCTYTKKMMGQVSDCIGSLKKQTLQPYEIILVLDPDKELIRFYKSAINDDVKILASDKYGLSNARNTGIRNSEGEIVAFIDDDARADEKWLEKLARNYDDPDVAGVGGFSKPMWQQQSPMWFPEELYWIIGCSYAGLPKHKAYVRNPLGCNMSFRKRVFEEVGYFKADIGRVGKKLLSDEETEFSIRVLEQIRNSKIVYDPQALVYHNVNRSRVRFKYIWNRSFHEGVGKAIIQHRLKSLDPLSTENSYIKYLLGVAVPSRIRKIYDFQQLSQLLTLSFSTFAVFTGFLVGSLRG